MIHRLAIKAFLERPRKDYRKLKALAPKQIEVLKNQLPVKPPIWTKLSKHQKVCFIACVEAGAFANHLDTGGGKTLLSIAVILYFIKAQKLKQGLVLVPNKSNKTEWARELEKHCPKREYLILKGSSKDKWADFEQSEAPFIIETFAGLMRMVSILEPHPRKKGQNRLRPDANQIKRIASRIGALVMDESTVASNRSKLPFRICRKICQSISVKLELSGTPFGKDPTPLWGQMYLLDGGETLGPTLGLFRAAFFTAKQNYWGGTDYTFDRSKEPLLHRLLANRSLRYKADEQDLPKRVPIIKEVTLPGDAKKYYEQFRDRLMAARGNYQEMKNAFLRMRQISSGWVGFRDDETGERASVEFPDKPKLELLLTLVQTLSPEHKFIIFHEFTFSGQMIHNELDTLGIDHVWVYGKTKDTDAALRRFTKDPSCRGFLAQSAAAAYGLNLQMARYGFFYESPLSVIVRTQCERRWYRQHSPHKNIFMYDLVTRGTYDVDILTAHAQGKSLFDTIIDGKHLR